MSHLRELKLYNRQGELLGENNSGHYLPVHTQMIEFKRTEVIVGARISTYDFLPVVC